MKLTDLDAHFLKHEGPGHRYVSNRINADGVMFQCPKCAIGKEQKEGYVIGVHYIICWFSNRVPADLRPLGRWNPMGANLTDLTFTGPGAYSIQVQGGCNWHGYLKDGEVE